MLDEPTKTKTKTNGKVSKMSKQKKAVKSTDTPHVGRPRFKVGLPAGHFTFEKLCIHNGALKEDGSEYAKGEGRCVPLTVRNNLVKMLATGEVIKLDKLGKTDTGLGRKPYLFARGTAVAKPAKVSKAKAKARKDAEQVTVSVTPTPTVETPTAETPTVEAPTVETPTVETPVTA